MEINLSKLSENEIADKGICPICYSNTHCRGECESYNPFNEDGN